MRANGLSRIAMLLIAILSVVLFRCHGKYEPRTIVGQGLNGSAYYVLDSTNHVCRMYKARYRRPAFSVSLQADTIFMGHELVVEVHASGRRHQVLMVEPVPDYLEQTGTSTWEYHFRPQQEGVHQLLGKIIVDSVHYPFQYYYVVCAPQTNRKRLHVPS